MKEVDVSSLEHTSWRCQYHVVFAPKYRRMEIYGKIKEDIGIILRKLCQQVDTVGRNKKAIKAYIQNQLEEDKISDQISIKEFIDPFTGSKNPKA
ncbi:MAG: transposase [Oscillospiraceae bacterium]